MWRCDACILAGKKVCWGKKGDSYEFMEAAENSIVARGAIWWVLHSSAVSEV